MTMPSSTEELVENVGSVHFFAHKYRVRVIHG